MSVRRRWIIGLLAAAVLAALAAGALLRLRTQGPFRVRMNLTDRGAALRTVTVYHLEPDSLILVPRQREVVVGRTRAELARDLVAYLAEPTAQARPALPRGTRLLHFFENGEGEAVMDLNAAIEDLDAGAIREERLRLSALVRTLAENLEGVERVRLLVQGRPLQRWGGHLIPGILETKAW